MRETFPRKTKKPETPIYCFSFLKEKTPNNKEKKTPLVNTFEGNHLAQNHAVFCFINCQKSLCLSLFP